jgi:hypothetical protein
VILPATLAGWTLAQREEFEERAGIVAADCHLPQRCEEAERRAEAVVRERWAKGGDANVPRPCPTPSQPRGFRSTR